MKELLLLLASIVLIASSGLAQESSQVHFARVYRPNEAPPPAGQNITYFGGPLMLGAKNTIYIVYYGNWKTSQKNIINGWAAHLNGTGLYNVNTTYHDGSNNFVNGKINFNCAKNTYTDLYSLGKSLNDANVQTIVANAISGGHLPNDTNGIYFLLTFSNVTESAFGGSFCTLFCGYHSPSNTIVSGETIKYSFVGDPNRCPSGCDGNVAVFGDTTTPNNSIDADGSINIMFHELSETVTDPEVNLGAGTTAWNSGSCGENGDCCNFTFGTTSIATNGSHFNQTFSNGKNYLIQEMFELTGTGFTRVPGKCVQTK